MARPGTFTPAKREKALALRQQGKTLAEIRGDIGVTIQTLSKFFRTRSTAVDRRRSGGTVSRSQLHQVFASDEARERPPVTLPYVRILHEQMPLEEFRA